MTTHEATDGVSDGACDGASGFATTEQHDRAVILTPDGRRRPWDSYVEPSATAATCAT
ncbi:hypothetical protein DFJ68_0992 [Terracoccus luteus]|uniref:Uncharacterized protein n=1 Tax=Terracoccus luteus TaxID=53356 RepID=A0A495XVN5_9MICO|nr:hypothetical protein DFJ68_0992 [Terracoccus luteus]